jgi:hypothetical protein
LYDKIPYLFAKLLIISIPVTLSLFIIYGSLDINNLIARSLLNGENSSLDEKMFLAPIIIAPLLVPFIRKMKNYLKFIVLLANSLVLIYGILTATRSFIAISLLSYLSIIKFPIITNINTNKLIIILSLTFITSILIFSNEKLHSFFNDRMEYTVARFNKKNDFTSGRNTEVEGLLKEFSKSELLFGRGAGAENKFGFWKDKLLSDQLGPNFTHFGFLYFILKGGFIMLFIVYGIAIYSMIVLFRHGERKYFFVILIYLTYEVSHTQFTNYFYVLFLWLSISCAFHIRMNKLEKLY